MTCRCPCMKQRQVPVSPEAFERFRTYHRLVLAFSKDALGALPMQSLLQRACECAAAGTSVERAKVLRYRPAADDLLVVAGTGWKPNVVGHASLPSDMRSPPGRAFRTGEPTFIDDLPDSAEFDYSDLLRDHSIISVVNVPIAAGNAVWGVLEVDSEQPRRFDLDDREFLCGFAEIIGRSIENREQLENVKRAGLDQRIELQERETLFRELQHRIANQLQLIIGALEIASRRASDANSREAIEEVIRRAVSIARSHEQLSLTRIEREISLQAFFNRLIPTLSVPDRIRVVTSIEDATAAIGTAVRLGLIVNELVTNSVKHAFGEAGGRITISLEVDAERNTAMLRVADDGLGMGKMPRSGMGIGLIQTLSAQIGGGADWAAADGGGTKFTLSFRLDSVRP
jgi:two-component sensor histidine kinase